jgi:hypothetical protein
MNQTTADEMINKAVKTAIKEFTKTMENEKKRKALHNTKMLLKNYRRIEKSIEEAIYETNQLKDESLGYDEEEELYINSILRSKLRSMIVVTHIDKALDTVKQEYKQKGLSDKYEAFFNCMIERMSYEEAAETYYTSKQSISRWVGECTKLVSVHIFGVDGIEMI